MLRAVALAARLDFTIEPPLLDAIRTHRHEIAKSSPPRLLEEYYKILRAGSSEKAFRGLADVGLLEPISAELHRGADRAALAVARRARRVPPPVRVDAGHADQRDPARQPARAARDLAAPAARPTTATDADGADGGRAAGTAAAPTRRVRGSASCRWRAATSSGCGRSSACSGGCAI